MTALQADVRAELLDMVLDRMQVRMQMHCAPKKKKSESIDDAALCVEGLDLKSSIVYKRDYGPTDFVEDHHSFRGNAFGLANVLSQSLILKPTIDALATNMVFAGHLTNPGPGVPPALVSGVVAANELDGKLVARVVVASASDDTGCITDALTPTAVVAGVVAVVETIMTTSFGSVICMLFLAVLVAVVAMPLIESLTTQFFTWLLPPLEPSPFKDDLTFNGRLLRFRSYLFSSDLIYKYGRTYFCASTLMAPQCFFDTAGMYALFRISDDYVDNDDERTELFHLCPPPHPLATNTAGSPTTMWTTMGNVRCPETLHTYVVLVIMFWQMLLDPTLD
jgi:hypothetical protein